jgi:hypothetical protein
MPDYAVGSPKAFNGAQSMIRHIVGLLSPSYRFRSAVTGAFVSKAYALLHPKTTVRERVMRDEGDTL